MPSENWNAFFKSGALPSELKYGYASAGPMAQGGIMAYLPQPGPQYKTGSVGTTGNYVNTAAGPTMGMAPPAVPYPVGGSVRYSPSSALAASAPPPAALISRGPIGPAPMSGAVAMPSGQRFSGSIRYGR
jgi:hypothetical protein